MRYLSVCSGIEAATVAWHPLGWTPVAFSEIEKFPSAVLAHHYPTVPNLGDMTEMDVEPLGDIDILVGGTPCQAFSVAGLRQSLGDARGNLSLSYVRLIHELVEHHGLRNAVWENVPGALNTKDNFFGCFLGAIVGSDDALLPPGGKRWPNSGLVSGPKGRAAWTIKDAQYFGLAQRRRRVFVVSDFGNGADPAAVLFELEGVRGNPAPSREARKDIAPTISARTRGGGGLGTDFDLDGGLVEATAFAIQERAVSENLDNGPQGKGYQPHIAYTLEARNKVQAVAYAPDIARCDATREGSSQEYETTTMVAQPIAYSIMPQNSGKDYKARAVDVAQPLMAAGPVGGNQGGDFILEPVCVTGSVTHTLKAEGFDASEDGTGRGNPIIAFSSKDYGADAGELSPTLRAGGHTDSHANAGVPPAIAFQSKASHHQSMNPDTISPSLQVGKSDGVAAFYGSAVRRLTPKECERLQGFPDGYTKISDKTADGPRYKALGNSMAVPVMRWIGERIERFMPREEIAPARKRLHFRADGRMEMV